MTTWKTWTGSDLDLKNIKSFFSATRWKNVKNLYDAPLLWQHSKNTGVADKELAQVASDAKYLMFAKIRRTTYGLQKCDLTSYPSPR